MLHMENTGLRDLEPYFLQSSGLYRLKISNNFLTEIWDDAFAGLERSLWELYLPHNELIEIPSKSFRHLEKLRHLDLSWNRITQVYQDSFRGLEDSLQTLILKENRITMLEQYSFGGLLILETLDLSGNNLWDIDASLFKDGMPRLSKLLLTDNILQEIPYEAVTQLKALRTLDLSHNIIRDMVGNNSRSSGKLNLDNFHIEYNHIKELRPNSFQYFDVVNRTFLDGNPIHTLKVRIAIMFYELTNNLVVLFISFLNNGVL